MIKYPYSITYKEVLDLLDSTEKGLPVSEAKKRVQLLGKNILEEEEEKNIYIFIRQFSNPLTLVLIAAAIITGFLGRFLDTGVITFIVLVNGFLGFFHELKAKGSYESLKKKTETKSKVLREGKIIEVPSSEITLGDIVILSEGDVVPADIRLIESTGLMVDESLLTGETVPVEKVADITLPEDTPVNERKNILFKGTVVVRGKGKGVVYAIGEDTEIGKITVKIKERSPETPLNRSIRIFTKKWIFLLAFVLSIIFILGLLEGKDLYTLSLLIVSEMVSAVPEGLPLVITFVLIIGALKLSKKNVLVKYLPAVETLGSTTYIIADKTGTITEGKLKVEDVYFVEKVKLLLASALCNEATDEKGDPLEVAILKWLDDLGFDWKKVRKEYKKLWEYPFDTNLRIMATVNEIYGKKFIFVKGAFETLKTIAAEDVEKLQSVHDKMAENGLKVIAVGYAEIDKIPDSITEIKINMAGLIGFFDPPKEGVLEAVEMSRKAGIKVVMVTGDNVKTAISIGKAVGIYKEKDIVMKGKDLNLYTDEELYRVLQRVSVVARATPEDKYRIVKVLQSHGEIVSVTGDGVNDVPALRVADLGIAMGSGSNAAKEVAKMIITDNNLKVIVDAIEYGRNIAVNLKKAIYYLVSCSLGELGLITSSFLLNLPLPLHPIQILWINLVTEGVQDKTFAFNKKEKNLMENKPERIERMLFDKKQIVDILFSGVSMAVITLSLFIYYLNIFNVKHATAVAFTSLVVNQWFNGIQATVNRPFFKGFKENISFNRYMFLGIGVGFVLQIIALYIFPSVFHAEMLSFKDWFIILLSGLVFFFLLEAKKWLHRYTLT